MSALTHTIIIHGNVFHNLKLSYAQELTQEAQVSILGSRFTELFITLPLKVKAFWDDRLLQSLRCGNECEEGSRESGEVGDEECRKSFGYDPKLIV